MAVDIVEAKRDKTFEFGATHFATSMPEATEFVGELTRGVMADSALLTVGLVEGPRSTRHWTSSARAEQWC